MLMLTDTQSNIVIIFLLVVIVFLLFKRSENFESTCKNGQCFQCKDKVYREDYCYAGPVARVCPDGYKLNNTTLLCDKIVQNEHKDYTVTARPTFVCGKDQIQLGDSCVIQATYYFDPKYT